MSRNGKYCSIRFNRFLHTASEIISTLMRSMDIVDFQIEEPDIERVIRNVYEKKLDIAKIQKEVSA